MANGRLRFAGKYQKLFSRLVEMVEKNLVVMLKIGKNHCSEFMIKLFFYSYSKFLCGFN